MRIYTARGDRGETDLLGARVAKDDPRIDLIGELDETTSSIGLGRALAARTALRMIHVEDAVFASWPEEDVAQYLALSERYLTALREQVRQL